MKDKPLEIIGKEGFLDTSKQPNFGTKTLYVPGINNVTSSAVYDHLLAERKTQPGQTPPKS
ncbi:TPA: hypothetical protein ACQVKY_005438 [Serratia marcescens]|uniref:Uncharacterized protein n=1 Tax=Serratia nevei TaxID=2703794 RepID=A0ABT7G5L0_9GAMM|nr:hypothetical protein [Serratia nevei]HAU4290866.1 hypothetical protein [Serratia marcescens]MDK5169037.1 hypothetical protein [Serratia nevei]MDK5298531.1 hypothetical protein [Serratia nevei]MEC5887217.1 hypothetical protein [Serratia nevei]HAU4297480.1 hypothetical protein [Serratia marcescens]